LRGFQWSDRYLPDKWYDTAEKIDDDEKYFEVPSMMEERRERVVWLGSRIAESGLWLRLEKTEGGRKRFGVNPVYDVVLDDLDVGPQPPTPVESVASVASVESVEYGDLPDATTFSSSSWTEASSGKHEGWQEAGEGVTIATRR
jgi:hypothetical protein